MTSDYHRIVLQGFLHLLHRGTKHVGMHLTVAQMVDLDVVAHGLNKQQVGYLERHRFVGGATKKEKTPPPPPCEGGE